MGKNTAFNPQSEATFVHLFDSEENEEIALHFINHMLTAKRKVKFIHISFRQFIRMCHADVHKQENIIKLVCIDEAYKEYIVLIVFSRKEDFAHRALVYLADAFSSQFDLDEGYPDFTKLKFTFLLWISNSTPYLETGIYIADSIDQKSNS